MNITTGYGQKISVEELASIKMIIKADGKILEPGSNFEVNQGNYKDECDLLSLSHGISVGYHEGSGLPSGRFIPATFVATKIIDATSSLLIKYMDGGATGSLSEDKIKNLEVTFGYYGSFYEGGKKPYFIVELKKASIVGIEFPKASIEQQNYKHTQVIYFTSPDIKWSYAKGNIDHDWHYSHQAH